MNNSSGNCSEARRNQNPREDLGAVRYVEQKDHGIWCVTNVKSVQRSWNAEYREQERRSTH